MIKYEQYYSIMIYIDDEEIYDQSYSVLEIHHQKNRTIRPPDPQSLGYNRQAVTSTAQKVASNAPKSLTQSSNSSHARASGAQLVMAHPHRERDQPSSQPHGNIRSGNTTGSTNPRVMATDNIDDAHNPNATDSDDHRDGDVSDASNTNVAI